MAKATQTGIYLSYPTSATAQPIFPTYNARVSNNNTFVGTASRGFDERRSDHERTFNGGVVFQPVALLPEADLKAVKAALVAALKQRFQVVDHTHQWFQTTDRVAVRDEIENVLRVSGVSYKMV